MYSDITPEAVAKKSEQALRELLESVYDATDLITFDELVEKYSHCLHLPVKMLFYLREKRWFHSESEPESDFLNFPFLSFELEAANVQRFSSLAELNARINDFNTYSLSRSASPRCVIYYQKYPSVNLTRIINLTKRLFVAFYLNCGSHDHFRQSVTSRLVREYYKFNKANDISSLRPFILEKLTLQVSIWHKKDLALFQQGDSALDLLEALDTDVPNQFKALEKCDDFKRNLLSSLSKQNQTFGYSRQQEMRYVINTFSDKYFVDRNEIAKYRLRFQQKAVAIYFGTEFISLDAVFYANRLIETVLHTDQEVRERNLLSSLHTRCFQIERSLALNPRDSKPKLDSLIWDTINDFLIDAIQTTVVDNVCIYLYEPFSKKLKMRLNTRQAGIQKLSCPKNSISRLVFDKDSPLDIPHLTQIKYDQSRADTTYRRIEKGADQQAHTAPYTDELKDQLAVRLKYIDGEGTKSAAVYAVPLRNGVLPIGVIEFIAAKVGRITPEINLLDDIAFNISEVIRRLELANDRGWFLKMSFIHAHRHQIEAVMRDVASTQPELAREYLEIMKQAEHVQESDRESHVQPRERSLSDRIYDLLVLRLSDSSNIDAVMLKIRPLDFVDGIPSRAKSTIIDVFSTIVANSSHADLKADDLLIEVNDKAGSSRILSIIHANDISLGMARMEKICVAPIPDENTPTYHYGLFLLSAQLRMIGGVALGFPALDDGFGNTRFGVSFQIPIDKE